MSQLLPLVAGLTLLTVAVGLSLFAIVQKARWIPAQATLADYEVRRSEGKPSGQKFFYPVVRFTLADGTEVTAVSSWGSWRKPWPIGTSLSVRYPPQAPQQAEVQCFANIWGIPLTFLILAIVAFAIWWWNG